MNIESFAETNNENNSSMLINFDKNDLSKSFNKLLPQKPEEARNQRKEIECKTHNSTKDTRNNINSNINSSFQKTFSLFNESNYDSNSQTDRSSNNIKEIKVIIPTKQKNINSINIQQINMAFMSEEKLSKIIILQKLWKKYYKIKVIPKYIRGFLVRKNLAKIIYFIKCIFKLLFKLMIINIKQNNRTNNKKDVIADIYNTDLKKNNNISNKIKKIGTTGKFSKNKLNSHPSFNSSNKLKIMKKIEEFKKIGNKNDKKEQMKKIGNNNPINVNLANKNKKITKNKKNKEKDLSNISNKDKLLANNIFNIYNNVKKYYENENNNTANNNNNFMDSNYLTTSNFYGKNKKNSVFGKNNVDKNTKIKKMVTRGSMKNINEKIIINKNNNINVNININNNPKTDRANRVINPNNKDKEINSILYLLKLKKIFLFWNSTVIKRKIVQKLKNIKNIQTPYNSRKILSIYSLNQKQQVKTASIKTQKINMSNSLINLKRNKITPQKLRMKNSNIKPNLINSNYTKRINNHCQSVESNNNSMINSKLPRASINNSFQCDKENNLPQNKNNEYSDNLFNKSVIVVNQYDRNNELKKDNAKKNVIQHNMNNNINETKKIYYFYAIMNLIDKQNKRKLVKKWFYLWKSLIRFSRSFINSRGIEEKIINFKNKKLPIKSKNDNKFNNNNNNLLFQNNSSSNFNCQTEAAFLGESYNTHGKSNTILFQHDIFTPNPLEKTMHPNLFKSSLNSSKIVYQKKLLGQNKMRNQSIHTININDVEDDRNNTLVSNNQELNYMNQTISNNFYNFNTYMNNSNDFINLNNSQCLIRRNNLDSANNNFQEGRIKKINNIEEAEIYFTTQNNTHKNSFIIGQKNKNSDEGFNANKINVNVVENYRKIEIQRENNENNRYENNKSKAVIATKQINFGVKNNKRIINNSHSLEHRNNNQSY